MVGMSSRTFALRVPNIDLSKVVCPNTVPFAIGQGQFRRSLCISPPNRTSFSVFVLVHLRLNRGWSGKTEWVKVLFLFSRGRRSVKIMEQIFTLWGKIRGDTTLSTGHPLAYRLRSSSECLTLCLSLHFGCCRGDGDDLVLRLVSHTHLSRGRQSDAQNLKPSL